MFNSVIIDFAEARRLISMRKNSQPLPEFNKHQAHYGVLIPATGFKLTPLSVAQRKHEKLETIGADTAVFRAPAGVALGCTFCGGNSDQAPAAFMFLPISDPSGERLFGICQHCACA